MRYLRSVYVSDRRSRVSLSKGSLIVSSESGKRRVPLDAIDAVTVIGSAHVTSDAIAACVRRSVRVTCLT